MAGDDTVYDELRQLSPERRTLLAQYLIRQRKPAPRRIPVVDRAALPSGGELPCSPAQERLWFLDLADPGSAAYVMPAAVHFRGPLDTEALGRALDEVVHRHEVLRTNIVDRAGVACQIVAPPAPVALPVVDLGDRRDVELAIDEHYLREAGRPFDLARDPLLRARLLRFADDEHVLLISAHHIACDGWSIGVIRHELTELYGAFRRGEPSPLPQLPVQYGDFAVWQRDRLDRGELDEQREYWTARLSDATALALPSDRPRSARRSSRGDAVAFRLEPELVARIDRLAAQEQVTQFMVLLATLGVLLWRWSGQDDLVIGSPVAGRIEPETEALVGFFVNTLPLRLRLAGDPTLRSLLHTTLKECTAAYANQEVPFEWMIIDAGANRSAGPVPLVQVMLALRNTPPEQLRLEGLAVKELPVRTRSTKFDLSVDLVPTAPEAGGGIDGRFEFSTDLFDRETVLRMVESFVRLLEAGTADADIPASMLPLISDAEGAAIIDRFSGESSKPSGPQTLHGLFERRVDHAPDAIAVAFGDRTLSYRELDERANQLAAFLLAQGVGRDQLVGISLPRSELMIISVLGILKAGAGYVPLDPHYPASRVAYMAADAQVPVVLTHSSVAAANRFGSVVRAVELDTESGTIAAMPADRPALDISGRGLAYVIYTSGSTGAPKGSANEHARVVNTMHGVNAVFGLTPADRMLAISSLNYDMSVHEVFGTLAAGATIVVPSDIETTDPEQLLELLVRQGVTAWSSAPALLDMLVGHTYQRGGMPGVRLRVVGLGGDRMPPALPARLAELLAGVRLLNLAGMTEVSYASLAYHVTNRTHAGGIPWGRPYANHRIYVLDKHGRPAPVGVPGELFIGGLGPGRGYWRRPSLTAERFLPDPLSPVPGGRMYATGDHARWLPNGDVDFLGRLDQQVKIRGFRIELGEVEAALAAHPQVNEPVVIAYEDAKGERRLAAYVTPRGESRPTVWQLRAYLNGRLPGHMVPSAYLVMDQLPLLPSGKLNRSALPAPEMSRPEQVYEEPADELERVLAGTWADLVGVSRVGAQDDFFELGGHSLLATRVVARIREMFRVELSIPGFLAAGTVHELAVHLREVGCAGGVDVDAVARLITEVAQLSPQDVRSRLD